MNSKTSASFRRVQPTSGDNQNLIRGNEALDFHNDYSIEFNEVSDFDCPLFDCKDISNSEGHLHDTIPHEDELQELDQLNSKQRKNLRAKKRKKSKYEVKILEEYFEKDPEWSRQTVKQLKPLLNLTVDQIYKWGYDRKHLVEKRKLKVTRKKRVRKAQTMKASTGLEKICPRAEDLDLLDEDENDVIHDLAFDQLASNSYLFEAGYRPEGQPDSSANCNGGNKSLYLSKVVTNLEILSDDKIDKNFFAHGSEAIDINSS